MTERPKKEPPEKPGPDQPSAPDAKGRQRRLPPGQDWLGDQLRALYGRYAEEPLPAELQSLLDRLEGRKAGDDRKGS